MAIFAQVVYCSRIVAEDEDVARAEVRDILEVSRNGNPRADITGALMLYRQCFAQVLEGPSEAVERLVEVIRADPRHRDVIKLPTATIADRTFPNWSMGFATADAPEDARRAEEVFDQAFSAPDAEARGKVVDLIRTTIAEVQIW